MSLSLLFIKANEINQYINKILLTFFASSVSRTENQNSWCKQTGTRLSY